jgi:hypothetical protein
MSTRANIIIKDEHDKLFFYRHSDGYPEGTLPTLEKFLLYVKEGKIRDNVSQSSGWLIIIGAEEYKAIPNKRRYELTKEDEKEWHKKIYSEPLDWKVGAYEPTTGIHGDIEFLYVIDLDKKTIEIEENWDKYK